MSAEAPSWAGRKLHLVGVGGAGMSGLALVAHALGAEVTGSDRADSSYCERLRAAGVEPAVGHDARNVPAGAEVIVSTAIAEDNPELEAARAAGAAVRHRGDLLAELAALKRCAAVGGTHGKTTTASMIAHVLVAAGRDPAYLIGGELRSTAANAAWGAGDWIVVEADESDRSFLKLAPEVAVVTNVELDHHATYRSALEIERAFGEFASGASLRVVWEREASAARDGGLARAARDPRTGGEVVTFGIEAGDLRAENVRLEPLGSRFEVEGTPFELRVPGEHNVLDALAAVAACRAAGVEAPEAAAAMATFSGAGRRFEEHGRTPSGARVFDDYAHHPTEVRATLEAARTLGADRIAACFQPHLYSRTRHLAREFGRALALADLVCVLDVYPARERAEDFPGVSGWLVAAATADAAGGRPVYWTPRMEDAEALLRPELGEGDLLLTLGAGDVDRLAARLVGAGETGEPGAAPATRPGSGEGAPAGAEAAS